MSNGSGITPDDLSGDTSPDLPPDTGAGSGEVSATVPLSQISQGGVPPNVGDKVDFSVGGTVQSVDPASGMATITVEDINGQAVQAGTSENLPGSTAAPETTSAMGKRLRAKAAASDAAGGTYG